MNSWQDDYLGELVSSKDEQSLFLSIAKIAAGLDFDYCAYGMRMPLPISNPAVVMFNNYPSAWQAEYKRRNYLAEDPTVKHALRSLAPLIWSAQVFADSPDLWGDAQDIGLRVGLAHPSRDSQNIVGLLTLARSTEALSPAEIKDKQFKLAWLTQTTHMGMAKHLAPKFIPSLEMPLSSREIEILRWTAEGKTASEIAEILRISARTVNFHVNHAVSKLGVANKTAATVQAAILGLL